MAGPTSTTTAARRKKPMAPKPAAKAADARDEMTVADLARGILAKEIRSRTVDVQRLAEAVLAGSAKPKKAKKADGGKKKDKSKKKLAKIPGQSKK